MQRLSLPLESCSPDAVWLTALPPSRSTSQQGPLRLPYLKLQLAPIHPDRSDPLYRVQCIPIIQTAQHTTDVFTAYCPVSCIRM